MDSPPPESKDPGLKILIPACRTMTRGYIRSNGYGLGRLLLLE